MCFEIVVRNGIPVTFITSAEIVTSRYWVMIGSGMSVPLTRTAGGCCRTVFPFRDPMSGPHTNSAFLMSCTVTGQLGMSPSLTYHMKSFVDGRHSLCWSVLAFSA